jgi:hypothetical protein
MVFFHVAMVFFHVVMVFFHVVMVFFHVGTFGSGSLAEVAAILTRETVSRGGAGTRRKPVPPPRLRVSA